MRALLIDPYDRIITEVETDGSLSSMHDLVGAEIVTMISVSHQEACWVDDEGYLRPGVPTFKFIADGGPQLLPNAGRGLILGISGDGGNKATKIKLEFARNHIEFPELETSGSMTPSTLIEGPFMRHPGDMVFDHGVLGGDPIFRERRNG